MALNIPPSLAGIKKYILKAKEVEKVEPVVAYYCLCYAVELGLQTRDKADPNASKFLGSLMDQMEASKRGVSSQLGDAGRSHLENFIMSLFQKADDIDRAGMADITTARMFNACAVFWDVLKQWGALQPDVVEKRKYALWKATDITAAIKRGEKPVPGPPGGLPENPSNGHGSSQGYISQGSQGGTYNQPTSYYPQYTDEAYPTETSTSSYSQPQVTQQPTQDYSYQQSTYGGSTSGASLSFDEMLKAESEAKSAVSALQFQDVETAVACLRRALTILKS